MRRCFISLELPVHYKKRLFERTVQLKKMHSDYGVKFVQKDNFHVTLHFLGNLDEKEIVFVQKIIQLRVEKLRRFKLFFNGISSFFPAVSSRILFIKGNGDIGALLQFQEETGKDLRALGIPVDSRPWVCHMTIARITGQRKIDTRDIHFPDDKIIVDEISLMESILSREGPQYRKISSFHLK